MKTSFLYIITIVIICISGNTFAQGKLSAEDYFNQASQHYIDNKKNDALKTLEKGLSEYQDNQKMIDLAEKLLEEQENKQDQQQQKQQEQQDKKKEEEKEEQEQNKDNKDQDKKEENKDGDGNKDKKEEQDKENKKEDNKGDKSEEEKKKEQEAQQKEMNPAQKNQAMQDLKALENKEKALLKKLNIKKEKGTPVKTEKDW